MTDIRRTLLWVVFTMSLVLLWDAWNKHTGQPSIFGPTPERPAASAPPAPTALPASQVGVPTPVAAAVPAPSAGVGAAAAGSVPVAPAPATLASDLVVVTTDAVKASFDSRGANLVRLELLHYADAEDRKRAVLLFEQSAERAYAAQTGLVTTLPGIAMPNHYTPMKHVPGPVSLASGENELQVRFESDDISGVKLAKVFTFKRGDYTIGVRHEVQNSGPTPVPTQLYLQLARDGNPPRGESSFYFTFTGPAVYTDAKKFEKVAFSDIEKGKATHVTSANDGWVAMVQHYFASAWLVPTDTK